MINRRNLILLLLFLVVLFVLLWRACTPPAQQAACKYKFPSYNKDFPPPAGTPAADIFELSQDYPETYPSETVAWTAIDFRTDPARYAAAVLNYCLEGNVTIQFKVQNNTVRKWYHAPWLDYGPKGREWRHGLTLERNSRPGELHPNQTGSEISWAIGFYNAPGGATIRKVWPDCGNNLPNPRACVFPEKTVAFKLLFSGATTSEVPYLLNSFPWTANIGPIGATTRSDQPLLLLQVDIAVKDSRSPVGWVFGTFIYDGAAPGATPWDRLKLVGLIWGNDPSVTSHMTQTGSFINGDLHETFINASLIPSGTTPVNAARMQHLGLGGRLNGPVDNPISSCISCHGKASVLKDTQPTPIENLGRQPKMFPAGSVTTMDATKFNDYFGVNVPAGSADINYNCAISQLTSCTGPATFIQCDYSLQLSSGIENYYLSIAKVADDIIAARAAQENR